MRRYRPGRTAAKIRRWYQQCLNRKIHSEQEAKLWIGALNATTTKKFMAYPCVICGHWHVMKVKREG